jgi:hypothetical protein
MAGLKKFKIKQKPTGSVLFPGQDHLIWQELAQLTLTSRRDLHLLHKRLPKALMGLYPYPKALDKVLPPNIALECKDRADCRLNSRPLCKLFVQFIPFQFKDRSKVEGIEVLAVAYEFCSGWIHADLLLGEKAPDVGSWNQLTEELSHKDLIGFLKKAIRPLEALSLPVTAVHLPDDPAFIFSDTNKAELKQCWEKERHKEAKRRKEAEPLKEEECLKKKELVPKVPLVFDAPPLFCSQANPLQLKIPESPDGSRYRYMRRALNQAVNRYNCEIFGGDAKIPLKLIFHAHKRLKDQKEIAWTPVRPWCSSPRPSSSGWGEEEPMDNAYEPLEWKDKEGSEWTPQELIELLKKVWKWLWQGESSVPFERSRPKFNNKIDWDYYLKDPRRQQPHQISQTRGSCPLWVTDCPEQDNRNDDRELESEG